MVCNSVLNACRYFHVTSGLVPDVMHDILEGSLELCMCHLLIYLVHERRMFSLDVLNDRIASIDYGLSEVKNKPTKIASLLPTSGHPVKIKQSGM